MPAGVGQEPRGAARLAGPGVLVDAPGNPGPGFPCRDQLPCNTVHPALHVLMSSRAQPFDGYRRETILKKSKIK